MGFGGVLGGFRRASWNFQRGFKRFHGFSGRSKRIPGVFKEGSCGFQTVFWEPQGGLRGVARYFKAFNGLHSVSKGFNAFLWVSGGLREL